jgi:hypothetical protein
MAASAFGPARGVGPDGLLNFYHGNAGGASTTTTVTLPAGETITDVMVSGSTSTTAVYVDTISANTFTATHASADRFSYIAFVKKI